MATGALPEGFTLLQITPRLDGGGVEQVTLDTAVAVARAGGRCLVASEGGALEAALAARGGDLIRLPVDSKNPLVIAANTRRLAEVIRRERVSLVHVRSRAPAFSAIAAGRATGVPVVATYHGVYSANSPLKRWYNGVMTRGDLTIANSAYTRDHIVAEHRLAAERIALAPEGVDTARFDPAEVSHERVARLLTAWAVAPDDRRPVLLLAARLTGWKGQATMIAALGRMTRGRDPVLILAGRARDDAEVARLQSMAAQAGLADRVRIVGAVDDMPAAYLAADLVVAPSTLPESFGRGVVEAGAMERPVLASPLGGPAETIVHGETGWLVPAGDVAAWAAATDAALTLDRSVRAAIGRAARARAARLFSIEAMTTATFAIYRRLLEARR